MCLFMREKYNHLYVDSHERTILLHSFVGLKNQLIQQSRYTDCIDGLIFKVINAPVEKIKSKRTGIGGKVMVDVEFKDIDETCG